MSPHYFKLWNNVAGERLFGETQADYHRNCLNLNLADDFTLCNQSHYLVDLNEYFFSKLCFHCSVMIDNKLCAGGHRKTKQNHLNKVYFIKGTMDYHPTRGQWTTILQRQTAVIAHFFLCVHQSNASVS